MPQRILGSTRPSRSWKAALTAVALAAAGLVPVAAGVVADVTGAPSAQAAAAFSCSPGTIYGVTSPSTQPLSKSGMYKATTTSGTAVISPMTAPSSLASPGDAAGNGSLNGLALDANGANAYAFFRYQSTDSNYKFRVAKYSTATDSWSWIGGTTTTAVAAGLVAGAASPATGAYLVGGYAKPAGKTNYFFTLFSVNVSTGAATQLGSFDTGQGANGVNGDIAFDRAGNLYILGAQNTTGTTKIWMLPAADLASATAAANAAATLPVKAQATSNIPVASYNGLAFDADGTVVLGTGTTLSRFDPSTWQAVGTAPMPLSGTALADSTDLASCAMPSTLSVRKDVQGRVAASDQFTLSVNPRGNTDPGVTLSATTSGTATGLQAAQTGPAPVVAGGTYDFREVMASGSTTTTANLPRDYTTTSVCTADYGDGKGPQALGSAMNGTTGSVTIPALTSLKTGQQAPAVVCTLTNSPGTADLTVAKTWSVTADGKTTSYADGKQPAGLTAALSLDTGTGAAPVEWGTKVTALKAGQKVAVSEKTTIDASMPGCKLTSSQLTSFNSTALTSDVPTSLTMVSGSNTATVTNAVTCDTTLTLNKKVEGGSADPAAWTLTAKTSGGATALTGATGKTGSVTSGTSYQLAESGGDARYVQDDVRTATESTASPLASGSWQCKAVDATGATIANGLGARDGLNGVITPKLGQMIDCTATNRTAFLTILKVVENVNGTGTATPGDWKLTATPSAAGLTPSTVTGSATSSAANKIQVRPGSGYALSEAGVGGYVNRAVQKFTGTDPTNAAQLANDANWSTVADPRAAVSVAADGQAVYRFINRDAQAFTLPLTGGSGASPYVIVGSIVVALALGTAWLRRRSRRSQR
ncbi:MAG: LPXTG cell wall anchor domain-containing protein [Arthrobacter sp.]|jgi:LPXTG-motif cell wall-anchored protein|nr:LPXTG cell wall anchor domain-containing protein [Arthrobacter sp.]